MQEQSGGAVTVSADEAASVVVDAARAAVGRIAPRELVVFEEIAGRWRAGQDRSRAWSAPGGSVGFGVDEALVSAIAIQAVSAAVGEVLVRGADLATSRWWRRRRPPVADPSSALGTGGSGGSAAGELPCTAPAERPGPTTAGAPAVADPAGPAVPLTGEQAERLRAACLRHAVALGLEPAAAELLADAVIGRMSADPDQR